MEKLEIRRMEKEDLDEICAIEEEAFSMPWSRKNFEESLELSHTLFLIALYGGKPVGYCGSYQSLEEAEITNVAVKKEMRGKGVGRELLSELFRQGRSRGAFAFTLEVRVSNSAAIHLYESLGFESLGVRRGFYEKPKEDALIMWKRWEAK